VSVNKEDDYKCICLPQMRLIVPQGRSCRTAGYPGLHGTQQVSVIPATMPRLSRWDYYIQHSSTELLQLDCTTLMAGLHGRTSIARTIGYGSYHFSCSGVCSRTLQYAATRHHRQNKLQLHLLCSTTTTLCTVELCKGAPLFAVLCSIKSTITHYKVDFRNR
jgi:hypothetical protein